MQTPPDGHQPIEGISGSELRRDVSVYGSYMWGYAAVGADIYTALGIITLAALGLAPLAFLTAGIVFALVGLCYAELASAYPLAGGGQYFTLRGLGDFAGLVAGSALVLDYTIDISLFTVVAFGYINYFLPWISLGHHITDFTLTLGPIHLAWLWLIESVIGIVVLIWLNVRGIKVSTNFNEVIGTIAIVAQTVIVLAGFVLVWSRKWSLTSFSISRHPSVSSPLARRWPSLRSSGWRPSRRSPRRRAGRRPSSREHRSASSFRSCCSQWRSPSSPTDS